MTAETQSTSGVEQAPKDHGQSRRDMLYYATAGMAAVATGAAVWPIIDSMNPTADVAALSVIDVDLSGVPVGTRITAKWHGKPIFISHQTKKQIAEAVAADHDPSLIDPATYAQRAQHADWMIQIGICTHLGCIPLGQGPQDPRGRWGGWYCPCHGSQYDTAGRIRAGPAPKNLYLPPYHYKSDTVVSIG